MNERIRALEAANRAAAKTLRKALETEPRVAHEDAQNNGGHYYPHLAGGYQSAIKIALSCLTGTQCHTCADTGIKLGSRPGSRTYCTCDKGQALASLESEGGAAC